MTVNKIGFVSIIYCEFHIALDILINSYIVMPDFIAWPAGVSGNTKTDPGLHNTLYYSS